MRTTLIAHGLLSVALGLAACGNDARAELVTHRFSGLVTSVSESSGPGPFAPNQTCSMAFTIERSTPGVVSSPYSMRYTNAITAVELTVNGSMARLAPGDSSWIWIMNDNPSFPPDLRDGYDIMDTFPIGERLLGYHVNRIRLVLMGHGVLNDTSLPVSFPLELMGGGGEFYYGNETGPRGSVRMSFNQLAVPARTTSWGRIKSQYSR